MQRFLDPEGPREPRHRAFRRLGRHLRRGRRHDGNLARRRHAYGPAAASPSSSTCPSWSRCSGPSPTCRRRRCSTCPAPHSKAASRRPSPARCPRSRRSCRPGSSSATTASAAQKVDPREDNALAITTDGRKLALDGRMLQPGPDFPGSKINALVGNVVRIWEKTEPTARHADDLLRHGRPPDALGILGLRRGRREAGRTRHPPPPDRRSWATPTPTPRSRPCSRRSGRARCAS